MNVSRITFSALASALLMNVASAQNAAPADKPTVGEKVNEALKDAGEAVKDTVSAAAEAAGLKKKEEQAKTNIAAAMSGPEAERAAQRQKLEAELAQIQARRAQLQAEQEEKRKQQELAQKEAQEKQRLALEQAKQQQAEQQAMAQQKAEQSAAAAQARNAEAIQLLQAGYKEIFADLAAYEEPIAKGLEDADFYKAYKDLLDSSVIVRLHTAVARADKLPIDERFPRRDLSKEVAARLVEGSRYAASTEKHQPSSGFDKAVERGNEIVTSVTDKLGVNNTPSPGANKANINFFIRDEVRGFKKELQTLQIAARSSSVKESLAKEIAKLDQLTQLDVLDKAIKAQQ
jgi:hypothetical protein